MMMRLILRDFFVEKYKETLRGFYSWFAENPPKASHRVELILDRQKGFALSPTQEGFMDWFNWMDGRINEAFLTDRLSLDEESSDLVYGENEKLPEITFIEDLVYDNDIEGLKRRAILTIDDGFNVFKEWSAHGRELSKSIQDRLDELDQIVSFPVNFGEISQELAEMLKKLDSLQRTSSFGSLHADMKSGKAQLLERMRVTSDKIKGIGIERARELFEQIWNLKNDYIKSVSTNRLVNRIENSPDVVELKKKIRDVCGLYMPVAEVLMHHFSDSAAKVENQMGTVQDIMALVALRPRGGRSARRKVQPRPETQETKEE
jgi:hypothetical protein